jgi:hypothetical protein
MVYWPKLFPLSGLQCAGSWHSPDMQPTMVHTKIFDIITWQPPSTIKRAPLPPPGEFNINHIFNIICHSARKNKNIWFIDPNFSLLVIWCSHGDKEFHPNCLQSILKKSEWGCLSDLKTKKRITQSQWNLLFPKTGRLLYLFCLNQFLYVMVLSMAWFESSGSPG